MTKKPRAPRTRTLTLTPKEYESYKKCLIQLHAPTNLAEILGKTIHQDLFEAVAFLPEHFVDLLFLDPPYNLNKTFHSTVFKKTDLATYTDWLDICISRLFKVLKSTASIYVCADWQSSPAVFAVIDKYFHVRNRIIWEREKGRGAQHNWKNPSEDLWFCTVSHTYTFNVDAVKLKRRVLTPYTQENGTPKDWQRATHGNFRLTHPSNLWTDLTVPFWSMPENTDHPTQKPEKLVAKVLLASSQPGDVIFDPFLGSGTTSVVAKKLHRQFAGIEIEETYCCWAEKRIALDRCVRRSDPGLY